LLWLRSGLTSNAATNLASCRRKTFDKGVLWITESMASSHTQAGPRLETILAYRKSWLFPATLHVMHDKPRQIKLCLAIVSIVGVVADCGVLDAHRSISEVLGKLLLVGEFFDNVLQSPCCSE
jgi:hypothetical protein